jgi:NADH:ubiquinone oxidoreductase subunit E
MKVNLEPARKIIGKYRNQKGRLISLLQDIQAAYGYVPGESIKLLSRELAIYPVEIYGVLTFYSQFYLKPRGRHTIKVCQGTACHVRGSRRVLEEIERKLNIKAPGTTKDMSFTLETVNCLGACALGPVVVIDGKYHGTMTVSGVSALLENCRNGRKI